MHMQDITNKFDPEELQGMKDGLISVPDGYQLTETKHGYKLVPLPGIFDSEEQEDIVLGPLVIKTANDWNKEAIKRPDPVRLYDSYWYEGEVGCLFADSNTGKSILAVQIGVDLARKGRKVLYIDCELNDKQFQQRFTSETGELYELPDTFLRGEYHPENQDSVAATDDRQLLKYIEAGCNASGADCLIIDNLTTLSNKSQEAEYALTLMGNLKKLKMQYGWSILVIAHTPKRDMRYPITDNDLAGSKALFNVFDSVFAMGRVAERQGVRYLKQLKCRATAIEHGAGNVQVMQILQSPDGFLHLEKLECCDEEELLEHPSRDEKKAKVAELRKKGVSLRKIANETGVPKTTVERMVKEAEAPQA